MRRSWVVRVGGAEQIDALRRAGRVGLPLEEVGNARQLTAQEIELAITPTATETSAQLRSRLVRFAADMHPGDLVIAPHGTHELWFAEITGPYEHSDQPQVPRFAHTRTAEWLGCIERTAPWVHRKLQYIDTPASVVELGDTEWWFEQLVNHPLLPERPARRAATAKPTRTRQPRAATPPKPVTQKEPELVLCAGQCGFQWRTAVLVDGLCPDCRGE